MTQMLMTTGSNPLSRSFSIGGVHIEQPLALAPMAEVTDTYYRSLIKELGGVGLVVSEFISAEGLTRKNDRSHQMLAFDENERPVAIQIYGGDPERMDDAAAIVEEQGVDIVDINMGCPVKKIVNSGAGSALLKDFDKAARVVEKRSPFTAARATRPTRAPATGSTSPA
jgi:tRNA-dihydrouridine synthase B